MQQIMRQIFATGKKAIHTRLRLTNRLLYVVQVRSFKISTIQTNLFVTQIEIGKRSSAFINMAGLILVHNSI